MKPTIRNFIYTGLIVFLVNGCVSESEESVMDDQTPAFISGIVIDGNTGSPIANAEVSTSPPTETRLTNSSGRYELKDSVIMGQVYDVTATQVGYSSSTRRVSVVQGASAVSDISLFTEANGLATSVSVLELPAPERRGSFLLSSTVPNTMFSFTSTDPAFRVSPSTGTINKNERLVVEVTFTPDESRQRVTGQLIANATNGATGVIVSVIGHSERNNPIPVDCESEIGNSCAPAPLPADQNTEFSKGLKLRTLDNNGLWVDGVTLSDNTIPKFDYDAHIMANARYGNFPIGGLVWSGYLNLEDAGEHVFRVSFDAAITDTKNWQIKCSTHGSIGNVAIGNLKSVTYRGSKTQDTFDSVRATLSSGLHEFKLTMKCARDNLLGRVTGWSFHQGHYSSISSNIQVLGPNDVSFTPLPKTAFFKD